MALSASNELKNIQADNNIKCPECKSTSYFVGMDGKTYPNLNPKHRLLCLNCQHQWNYT